MNGSSITISYSLLTTISIAALAGAYTLGRYDKADVIDSLEKQIKAYNDTNTLKLTELVTSLKHASETIALNSQEVSKLRTLEKNADFAQRQLNESNDHIDNLNNEIKGLQSANEQLTSTLAKYQRNTNEFSISQGQSYELLPEGVFIGLSMAYRASASLTVNNKKVELDVGEYYELNAGEKLCTLVLLSSEMTHKANFKFICKES
ncbi:hypothetical protein [Vibrio fluvialis]|uniref:hypothetical protein n=1 Tax=Vibrio fluvialis TaxID=676 RepID=UPI001EEC6914|nr:hypothetical protein [Vibrio fluvialis]MCG6414254.1 hypothetical protein [Vibrio fluvialis]